MLGEHEMLKVNKEEKEASPKIFPASAGPWCESGDLRVTGSGPLAKAELLEGTLTQQNPTGWTWHWVIPTGWAGVPK